MADVVAKLLVDPLVDEKGVALAEADCDENLRKQVRYVKSLKTNDLLQAIDGKPVIELLDARRNTISYIQVLLAYLQRQLSSQELGYLLSFLVNFDPVQIRYVGSDFRYLIDFLATYYEHVRDASIIPFIASAILRLDPDSSTFTSNHLTLVRLCLLAQSPRQALPVLDKDIYNLPVDPLKNIDERYPCSSHQLSATYITKSSGISAALTPSDVQEYYLLGAQIYIGLRQFSRARLFLELVLATPTTHVATPLMVEAYKKLILVGLLSTGTTYPTKGLLDQQTLKSISSLSRPYEVLADAFKGRQVQRFLAELDTAMDIWDHDGNTAIVNQVAESLRRWRVIDLQKTFSSLSVDRIAPFLGSTPSATTTLLNTMIRDGHLKATLQSPQSDSAAPVLRFQSHDTQAAQPADSEFQLQQKYARVEQLSKHVREADRKLSIAKEYVDFVRRSKRAEGAGAPGFEDPMEIWDGPIGGDGDEDMMADL